MRFRRLAVLGGVTALLAAGCGDDESADPGSAGGGAGQGAGETAAQAAGDVERYCELTAQLDRAGDKAFENIPESSDEQEIKQAVRRLLDDNRQAIEELQRVAPAEIRSDVRTFVRAQERGTQIGEEAFTPEVQQAEERLQAFEKRACGDQGGSGGSGG